MPNEAAREEKEDWIDSIADKIIQELTPERQQELRVATVHAAVSPRRLGDPARDGAMQQAAIIDFAVAFRKSDVNTKAKFVVKAGLRAALQTNVYEAIVAGANEEFHITLQEDVLRGYWELLKRPNQDTTLSGLLHAAGSDPNKKRQWLQAAKNYDEVTRVARDQGANVSTADVASYFAPWRFLAGMAKKLLDRKAITEAQFQKVSGFPSSDYNVSGMGSEVDKELLGGLLNAIGILGFASGVARWKLPIAAILFPAAAVIIGDFEGETHSFQEIGNMIRDSFVEGLEQMGDATEELHDKVSGMFS